MTRTVVPPGTVLLLAVLFLASALSTGVFAARIRPGKPVTLSGLVTARDGSHFTLKTGGGKVYLVDAGRSTVLLDGLPGRSMNLRVGDRARVFGAVSAGNRVRASRVRIFLMDHEVRTTATPPLIEPDSSLGAGPNLPDVTTLPVVLDNDVQVAAVGDSLGSWRSRGLVLGVRYGARTVTVATSSGPFEIDAGMATVVAAGSSLSISRINEGDAIRIWGDVVGLHKIRADRIEILRGKALQEASTPIKKTSVAGTIDYIDYPSFTFEINTGGRETQVLVDENTFIQFQGTRKAFMDLGIRQKVKVTGFGNMGTGFVASQIQVIGDPGR